MNCSSVKWLTQQSHPAAETFNHLSNSSSEGGPYGDLLCKLLLPGMTVNFEIIMKVTQHVFSIKLQNGVNIEAIKLFNPICIKSFKIANLSVMFCSLKQVTSQEH